MHLLLNFVFGFFLVSSCCLPFGYSIADNESESSKIYTKRHGKWLEKILKLDYWYIAPEAIAILNRKPTLTVNVRFEWWFYWLIQQSELNGGRFHELSSFLKWVLEALELEKNKLESIKTIESLCVVIFCLFFSLCCLWFSLQEGFGLFYDEDNRFLVFLASMIKWYRLQAVKVVVHLIDLPSSFKITQNHNFLIDFDCEAASSNAQSSLILSNGHWTPSIRSFRTYSKKVFYNSDSISAFSRLSY